MRGSNCPHSVSCGAPGLTSHRRWLLGTVLMWAAQHLSARGGRRSLCADLRGHGIDGQALAAAAAERSSLSRTSLRTLTEDNDALRK